MGTMMLGNKILNGIAVWMICQLFVAIWWASNLTTRLEQIEENMIQTSEISERLIRVETQLTNMGDVLCSLRAELKELRTARAHHE